MKGDCAPAACERIRSTFSWSLADIENQGPCALAGDSAALSVAWLLFAGKLDRPPTAQRFCSPFLCMRLRCGCVFGSGRSEMQGFHALRVAEFFWWLCLSLLPYVSEGVLVTGLVCQPQSLVAPLSSRRTSRCSNILQCGKQMQNIPPCTIFQNDTDECIIQVLSLKELSCRSVGTHKNCGPSVKQQIDCTDARNWDTERVGKTIHCDDRKKRFDEILQGSTKGNSQSLLHKAYNKTHRILTDVDASTKRTSTKVGRPAMVRERTVVLEKERMDLVEF